MAAASPFVVEATLAEREETLADSMSILEDKESILIYE
jgi:hypothetical protein